MTIKHAIISCPRPVNYISHTLDSFAWEWPYERVNVYEEPGHIGYNFSHICNRIIHKELLGCVENWVYAVKHCYETEQWDWLIITEDDIYWRHGSGKVVRDFIEQQTNLVLNDFGYATAYCAEVNRPLDGKGWQKVHLRGFGQCGALCMIFPRTSINYFFEHLDYFREKAEGKHLDTSIGYVFEKHTNYVHNPTLILHNGAISCSDLTNKNTFYHQTREPAL